MTIKAAVYARVSTLDQNCQMQLTELREFNQRSGWEAIEYVDQGVSGAKRSRPALDRLMSDARLKKFGVVVCWKLDRFGRSMIDLISNVRELDNLGIRFVAPSQGIDTDSKSPTGRLILHILAALAEFERELIRERCQAGLAEYNRAMDAGLIGKQRHSRSGKDLPCGRPPRVFRRDRVAEMRALGHSWRKIAWELKLPLTTVRQSVRKPS